MKPPSGHTVQYCTVPPGHTVQYTSTQTTSSTTPHTALQHWVARLLPILCYTHQISATTQPPPTIYTYLMFIILLMSPRTDALHGPRPSYCLLIYYILWKFFSTAARLPSASVQGLIITLRCLQVLQSVLQCCTRMYVDIEDSN